MYVYLSNWSLGFFSFSTVPVFLHSPHDWLCRVQGCAENVERVLRLRAMSVNLYPQIEEVTSFISTYINLFLKSTLNFTKTLAFKSLMHGRFYQLKQQCPEILIFLFIGAFATKGWERLRTCRSLL